MTALLFALAALALLAGPQWFFWCCCSITAPCPHKICVPVVDCDGAPKVGLTISAYLAGVLKGECTTDATGHCCICVSDPGTYQVRIGLYQINVVVNAGDAETDVPVFTYGGDSVTVCVSLTRCGGNVTADAGISFTTPTGFSSGSLSPDHSMFCFTSNGTTLPVPVQFPITWMGCYGVPKSHTFSGGSTNLCGAVAYIFDEMEDGFRVCCVSGCDSGPLEGVVVTVNGNPVTTGADGCATFSGTSGAAITSITTSGPDRFDPVTVPTTDAHGSPIYFYGCCASPSVTIWPDADHICCDGCHIPYAKAWTLTTPCGGVDLVGFAGGGEFGSSCQWVGCFTIPNGGCGGGAAGAVTPVKFILLRIPSAWRLEIWMEGWTCNNGDGTCTGGYKTDPCPPDPMWAISLIAFSVMDQPGDCTTHPVILSFTLPANFPDYFDGNYACTVSAPNPCAGACTASET
jgi:hypothetical protein